jgi:DNA-directed RNA polymerase subunit RPC12/RpoP
MAITCKVCGKPNPEHVFHCSEHYHCADCGTREGLCTHTEDVLCEPCHQKRVEKRVAEFAGDTKYTNEITCPHCGGTMGDSWECNEGEQECNDCGRKYDVIRHVEVSYSTSKR